MGPSFVIKVDGQLNVHAKQREPSTHKERISEMSKTLNLSFLSFCCIDYKLYSRSIVPQYNDHCWTDSIYWNFFSIHGSHTL